MLDSANTLNYQMSRDMNNVIVSETSGTDANSTVREEGTTENTDANTTARNIFWGTTSSVQQKSLPRK